MPDNSEMEALAREAATAADKAKASASQLALFERPDTSAAPEPVNDEPRKAGRPKGAKNKAQTALRDILIARGYRDPASILAHMAGMNSDEDPRVQAIALAEAIQQAARDDTSMGYARAEELYKIAKTDRQREAAYNLMIDAERQDQRFRDAFPALVTSLIKIMENASASLLPYIFPKVTPDAAQIGAQMVIQMAQPMAQNVVAQRVGPPPMPTPENVQNQSLSEAQPEASDGMTSDKMPNKLKPKEKSE